MEEYETGHIMTLSKGGRVMPNLVKSDKLDIALVVIFDKKRRQR